MMDASPMGRSLFDSLTRRRFGIATGGALTTLFGVSRQQDVEARRHKRKNKNKKPRHADRQVKADLEPIGDSGISGFVTLHQLKNEEGTSIVVHANGLTPGTEYLSLYYENDVCDLEPDSLEDQIGDTYFPNPAGIGQTHGEADEDLDEIGSVSVRLAANVDTLLACAKV
jgi:hypothetical protein